MSHVSNYIFHGPSGHWSLSPGECLTSTLSVFHTKEGEDEGRQKKLSKAPYLLGISFSLTARPPRRGFPVSYPISVFLHSIRHDLKSTCLLIS